jgi:predicted acylesterase/phospholipase RssA
VKRRSFLSAVGAFGIAPALLGALENEAAPQPLERSLVLSGGGARGAYEAGVIGALAATGGVSDGSPLRPYQVVCGTSIGALNGWFVATGQYTKLRDLWYGISATHIIRPKKKYAALRDAQSGVLNRAASAISLLGLVKNETGLLQSEPVYDWISHNIDQTTPVVTPLVWAVTNLTHQRPEYFFVRPARRGEDLPEAVLRALQVSLGPHTVVREATAELLHRAMFSSAAIPIAFDPVLMPGPDGRLNAYCDGGVASNSPVGIAHAISNAADIVLLDPPFEPDTNYEDAVEVAFGAYGTMQRKILEIELRDTYFQSVAKREFEGLAPAELARITHESKLGTSMLNVSATDLRYIRPKEELPLGVVAFSDQEAIGRAYRIGWEDVVRGFTTYDWSTFEL